MNFEVMKNREKQNEHQLLITNIDKTDESLKDKINKITFKKSKAEIGKIFVIILIIILIKRKRK